MDWLDIGLHAMAAIAFVGLIGLWFPRTALVINTVVWPAREVVQHWPDPIEVFSHPQSLLEWVVPVILGWLVFEAIRDSKW